MGECWASVRLTDADPSSAVGLAHSPSRWLLDPPPLSAIGTPRLGTLATCDACDASVQKTVVEPPAVRFRRHGLGGSPSTCAKARKASETCRSRGGEISGSLRGAGVAAHAARRDQSAEGAQEAAVNLAFDQRARVLSRRARTTRRAQSGSPSASRAASSELYVHRLGIVRQITIVSSSRATRDRLCM